MRRLLLSPSSSPPIRCWPRRNARRGRPHRKPFGTANKERITPWLVKPLPRAGDKPATRQTIEAETQSRLLSLAAYFNAEHQGVLEEAAKTGTPTELVFPSGERAVLSSFV